MDSAAHRIMKNARDLLVDGLLVNSWGRQVAIPHGMTEDQWNEVVAVADRLWRLIVDDPAPPACMTCATALVQPATGRPRRYCSAACRQADYRDRQP